MMLFIEEVLQVLAIELVGVGVLGVILYAYWNCVAKDKKVR